MTRRQFLAPFGQKHVFETVRGGNDGPLLTRAALLDHEVAPVADSQYCVSEIRIALSQRDRPPSLGGLPLALSPS